MTCLSSNCPDSFDNTECPCIYYKCEEGAGQDLIDAFGNYNLPQVTIVAPGAATQPGVVNKGRGPGPGGSAGSGYFQLNSVTEQCFSIQNTGGTFACWAFDNSGSTGHVIMSKSGEWDLRLTGNNPGSVPPYTLTSADFVVYTNTGAVGVTIAEYLGDFRINYNEWYFIVAWVNHAEQKIYLRVKSKTTPSNDITKSTSYAGQTLVGIASNPVYCNYGSAIAHGIDEAGFYTTNLTTDQQNSLYNNGYGTRPSCVPDGCLSCSDEFESYCTDCYFAATGSNLTCTPDNFIQTTSWTQTDNDGGCFSVSGNITDVIPDTYRYTLHFKVEIISPPGTEAPNPIQILLKKNGVAFGVFDEELNPTNTSVTKDETGIVELAAGDVISFTAWHLTNGDPSGGDDCRVSEISLELEPQCGVRCLECSDTWENPCPCE